MIAKVIIGISHEAVDRPFDYIVPENLEGIITEGAKVTVPFGGGNTLKNGYCIGLTNTSDWPEEKLKSIVSVDDKSVDAEGASIELARWMKKRYGCTMINAIKTVLPVKKKIKENTFKSVKLNVSKEVLDNEINSCKARQIARKRLLLALREASPLPLNMIVEKLGVSQAVVNTLAKNKIVLVESLREYRVPKVAAYGENKKITLSEEQEKVVESISGRMFSDNPGTTLLYGITGSGKTEVYMELIDRCLEKGRKAIVLIPEISLTFQTLMRFYARFGSRVSLMHSKLSDGEKYDQYERALKGELDIIIGPRSALFTPFDNIGIIIIDEEHEGSYKSEKMPKYHGREVAEHIAKKHGALLLLGSATPSMESYFKALNGEYSLEKLTKRNNENGLATVKMVDMREELKAKNRSYFSRELKEKLTDCIANGHQAILFINRRGFAGFVSCRECGFVLKCPHCDVAMSEHNKSNGQAGKMVCHYCGYEIPTVTNCPECASKYFAGFRAGTEKIEQEINKLYPSLRVLRMDGDTTKNRDDYDRILSAFASHEADVLVGTQMIVKGHDFPNVTLVGVIAADLSLNASDYRAAEKTFQLVTQAAGRAGRGQERGNVIIQTYNPENYALRYSALQDYEGFYQEEMAYRELADYPPVMHLMAIQVFGKAEEENLLNAGKICDKLKENYKQIFIIGPAPATISKISDIFRAVIYVKHESLDKLIEIRDQVDQYIQIFDKKRTMIQYDIDPISSF